MVKWRKVLKCAVCFLSFILIERAILQEKHDEQEKREEKDRCVYFLNVDMH